MSVFLRQLSTVNCIDIDSQAFTILVLMPTNGLVAIPMVVGTVIQSFTGKGCPLGSYLVTYKTNGTTHTPN